MGTIEVNAKVSTIEVDKDKIVINLDEKTINGVDVSEFFFNHKIKAKEEWKVDCNGEVTYKQEYKDPIIGEMAIFWGVIKKNAVCALYNGINRDKLHISSHRGVIWDNAILFESIEQFKEFIK